MQLADTHSHQSICSISVFHMHPVANIVLKLFAMLYLVIKTH